MAPNYNPEKGEPIYFKISTEMFAHHYNTPNDAREVYVLLRYHAAQIGS